MKKKKKLIALFLTIAMIFTTVQLPVFAVTIEQKSGDVPTVDSTILTPQAIQEGDYKEATNSFDDGNVKYYLLTQDAAKAGLTEIEYKGTKYPLAGVKVVTANENFSNIKYADGLLPLKTGSTSKEFTLFIDDGIYNDTNATNYTAFSHENASYVGLNEGGAVITKAARTETTTPAIAGRIERNIIQHKNVYMENLVFDGLNRDMLPVQYKQGNSTKKYRGEYFFNITGNHKGDADGLVMRNLTIRNVGDDDFGNDTPYSGWTPAPVKNVAINVHYNPGQINIENIKIENVKTAAGYGTVQVQDGDATYIRNINVDMAGANETAWPMKVETTSAFTALSMNQQKTVIESFNTSNVKKSETDCIYVQDYRYEFIKYPSDYKYAVWRTSNGNIFGPAFLLYKNYPASEPQPNNNNVLHDLTDNYWVIDYGTFAVDDAGNTSSAAEDRTKYIEAELGQILKTMNYTKDHYSDQSNKQAAPPAYIKLVGPEIPGFTVPDGYANYDTHIVAINDKDVEVTSKELVPFVDFDNGRTDLNTVSAINLPETAGKEMKLYNFDFHTNANYTMHEAITGIADKVDPLTDPLETATEIGGTALLEAANRYDTYYTNKAPRVKNSTYDTFVNDQFTVLNKEIDITNVPAENKLELGTTHTLDKEVLNAYTNVTPDTTVDQIDDDATIWVSSDPSIATVDANGVITPVAEGTVKIYLKATDQYNQGEIEKPWDVVEITIVKKAPITVEIPIAKTVEVGGNVAPGANEFEFEIAPYGNPDGDISGLTITGTTISTDGAGKFTGTITIVGDEEVINNAEGLKLTEKNDGAEGWTYDDTTYIVYPDNGNGMLIQKDMGEDMNPETVETAEFTNVYTENVDGSVTIPFKKTVALGGDVAPGGKTFTFDIAPYGNADADISALTITGNTIATDGEGDYTGVITITGDLSLIGNAEGLKLTEKNDGEEYWDYDGTEYIIWVNEGQEGFEAVIQKDMGEDMNPENVETAEFTNTYTKDEEPPQEEDPGEDPGEGEPGEENPNEGVEGEDIIKDPEKPEDPEQPSKPEKPSKPVQPEKPVQTEVPKTGDANDMTTWLVLGILSAATAATTLMSKRKKYSK